jgi:Tfp pilus assembly protein PilO
MVGAVIIVLLVMLLVLNMKFWDMLNNAEKEIERLNNKKEPTNK